jgi:hypothetical protein
MRLLLLAAFFVAAGSANAAVVYTYTGNAYDSLMNINNYSPTEPVPDPYDTSMRVTGTLVMPDEFEFGYNFPIPGDEISFSFSDGVNTLTNENSTLSFIDDFIVDAEGKLIRWGIRVNHTEYAANGSAKIVQSIRTLFSGRSDIYNIPIDQAVNFDCKQFSGYACYAPYERMATIEASPGTWVKSSVVPLPAAVWLFGSALAGLGWLRQKPAV